MSTIYYTIIERFNELSAQVKALCKKVCNLEADVQDLSDQVNAIQSCCGKYSLVLGAVTTQTIEFAEHNILEIRDVKLYDPDGYEASIHYLISGNSLTFYSNIPLTNFKIEIY